MPERTMKEWVEYLACEHDCAPWVAARHLANLIEKGHVASQGETPEAAVANLRELATSYGRG